MKTNRLLFLLMAVTGLCNLNAQIPNAPTEALTPNAASLGLYGDIPVSLYTGTPEISIPLYDVRVSDFTLPISLNYHASGIYADQRPGWVGLGWSLFAGGVITRKVNDIPDDYDNNQRRSRPECAYSIQKAGYFYQQNILRAGGWDVRSYLRTVAQDVSSSIVKDQCPDEFSFNFLNYSGKFYLNHTGQWVVQCDKPVIVQFDSVFLDPPFDKKKGTTAVNDGYTHCFKGFTIITEDGTKYQFGGTTDAIEYSIGFFSQYEEEWLANAWYLTKIILPTHQEITLNYERTTDEYINQLYVSIYWNLGTISVPTNNFLDAQCIDLGYSTGKWNNIGGQLLSPVYLKEIITDNAFISFKKSVTNELNYNSDMYKYFYDMWSNYKNRDFFLPILNSNSNLTTDNYPNFLNCLDKLKWYKLDNIKVQDKNKTETLKTIDFTYSNSSTQRLTLQQVTESGKKPYVFAYNKIEELPEYLVNKSDHWGFFNNTLASFDIQTKKDNGKTVIDTAYTYPKLRAYYNYRNTDSTCTKYGILNKITYPTGGYTEFEYESHDYRKQTQEERWTAPVETLSSNLLAGGVRIKRIKNCATIGGAIETKEYYYVTDYLKNKTNASISSGVLGGRIRYFFTDYTVYAFNSNNRQQKKNAFSSNSVLPACLNAQGSHIGYSEVIEKRSDNAFTRYLFTNFDNGYMDEKPEAVIQASSTPYAHYNSKDKERGLLFLTEDYNAAGVKVKSKKIEYQKDNTTDNYVRAIEGWYKNLCSGDDAPPSADSYDEGTAYKFYTYLMRPETEIDTVFENNNAIVNKTQYKYNSKKLLSEVGVLRSDGKTQKTKYTYPSDIQDGFQEGILRKMVATNTLSNYVEKISCLDNDVIGAEIRVYNGFGDGDNPIYKPEQIQMLRLGNPINESQLYSALYQSLFPSIASKQYNQIDFSIKNFDITYPAKISINMSYSEKFIANYTPLIYYTIEIINNQNSKSVFKEEWNVSDENPNNGYCSKTSSLLVDILPGHYRIELKRGEKNAPQSPPSGIDYQATASCNISEKTTYIANSAFQSEIFYKYDSKGNIRESKPAGSNIPTTYLWGYNYQYLIAKIENATYESVKGALQYGDRQIEALGSLSPSQCEELRTKLPNALVTIYTYKPLVGVETMIDPRGVVTKYDYDPFGRLIKVTQADKVIETYEYHYKN